MGYELFYGVEVGYVLCAVVFVVRCIGVEYYVVGDGVVGLGVA